MPSAFFLAQTAAQFGLSLPSQAQAAWMACHFSPYGPGLSNLPASLPPGCMLIVNDQMPPAGHDPQQIAAQLQQAVAQWTCSHVLLDLERPRDAQTDAIAKAIVEALPCPVGVSACYAENLDCAVFLPPLPLHNELSAYIEPWNGRDVWLELMPDCVAYTVTEAGCQQARCSPEGTFPHYDDQLFCRYRTEVEADHIRFTLKRGPQELALLANCGRIGCFVGLYQEFAQPEAQATAFFQ